MNNLSFGEWIGNQLRIKVARLGDDYFNADALEKAAQYIDRASVICQMSGEKLDPLQTLAIEVLVGAVGYKTVSDASKAYNEYRTRRNDE